MSVFPQPRWPRILGALQHAYDACSFKGRAEMQLRLRSRFSLGFRVGAVTSIQPFSLGEVSNFLAFFLIVKPENRKNFLGNDPIS